MPGLPVQHPPAEAAPGAAPGVPPPSAPPSAEGSRLSEAMRRAIYGEQTPEEKNAAYQGSLQRWGMAARATAAPLRRAHGQQRALCACDDRPFHPSPCAARWWHEYAGRKNEEEDMVADSLM